MGVHFPLAEISSAFHSRHHVSFECVALFHQFIHTFRIRAFDAGQSLQISRLPSRTQVWSIHGEFRRRASRWFPCRLLPRRSLFSRSLFPRQLHWAPRLRRLADSSLRLRRPLLGFLFLSHGRSLASAGRTPQLPRGTCSGAENQRTVRCGNMPAKAHSTLQSRNIARVMTRAALRWFRRPGESSQHLPHCAEVLVSRNLRHPGRRQARLFIAVRHVSRRNMRFVRGFMRFSLFLMVELYGLQ